MRVVLAVSALLLLCLAPMLSAAGPPVAKSEFKVTDIGDSTNEIVQLAKQDIVGQPTPPANVKGKPAKGTGTMTYYEVQAHGTQIPLAVDYTPGSSKLYVATDGSGDLSRCPPLQSWQLPSKNHAFPAFQVKIGEDKVGLKVEVMGPNRLLAYPATMLGGTVKFGDKPYRVLLVDAELDGSYNHYYAERAPTGTRTSRAGNAQMGAVMSNGVAPGVPPYDIFAIDLKGTGKIEPEVGGVMEAMPLPKMLRVNGAYYKITVSADGQSVDTSKVESPQTGTLTVACDCLDLGLCSEDGGYRVFGGRTKLELPASDYIVTGYRLVKKDARGDLWTINGYTSAISQGRLAIKTGETENLKVGAPVVVKASVSPIQAGVVTIGFSLLGASGEPLESGALKNGVRQPAPQIKIVASDSGKVLSQGSFGYT